MSCKNESFTKIELRITEMRVKQNIMQAVLDNHMHCDAVLASVRIHYWQQVIFLVTSMSATWLNIHIMLASVSVQKSHLLL